MARGNPSNSTLTKGGKAADLPSPTDSTHHSDNFDFPTLNTDGSVSDLIETHPPPGQRTPPAALSSLGLRMAASSNPDGVSDLNDGEYDMMSDVSDSNETVSIASDNLTSDDEMLTPDYDEDEDASDQGLYASNHPSAAGPSAGPLHEQLVMLDQHQHQQKLRLARERKLSLQKEQESEKERQMNSFLSEDLETPHQSTMNVFNQSSSTTTLVEHSSRTKSSSATNADKPSPSSPQTAPVESLWVTFGRKFMQHFVRSRILFLQVLFLALGLAIFEHLPSDGPANLQVRREALSGALGQLTNSTNATKSFNIEHLLPVPTSLPTFNIFGKNELGTSEVHFQGAQPNYIVVSLPRKNGKVPRVASTTVYKGDKPIAFNQTKLINGVYAITFDPNEAHGIVTVAMPCKKPELNITVSHNFGRRYLHLPNFEKARTDISNTVTKDIAVARAGARGITDCFTAIWGATHNVSSQLVKQVGHEAQLLANNTVSLAGKWYLASDATATAMRKDIVAVQEGFARAEAQVDDFVADVAGRVKRSVMEPLAVAHDRAGRIRAKYFGNEAAREKVCKRGVPAKGDTAALFAASPKHQCKKVYTVSKMTDAKNGKVSTKTTCGFCDSTKKNLGPRGLDKKNLKAAA